MLVSRSFGRMSTRYLCDELALLELSIDHGDVSLAIKLGTSKLELVCGLVGISTQHHSMAIKESRNLWEVIWP